MSDPLPLIDRAARFGSRMAIVADDGSWGYSELLAASARVAARLLAGAADLAEAPIAFLTRPGPGYVAAQQTVRRAS